MLATFIGLGEPAAGDWLSDGEAKKATSRTASP